MKITEIENEDALDVLADLIDPITEIFTDEEIRDMARKKANKLKLTQIIIKNHKKAIICILAKLDGVKVEEYHGNLIKMTKQVLELFEDEELVEFFTMQGQKISDIPFGSATENITAAEK